MKNATFYICDYAKVAPDVLVNCIINATDRMVWAYFTDIDEDFFRIDVFNPYEGEDLTAEDATWAYELIKPYLAEPSE